MANKFNTHCSQRVTYFMDPAGGAPQNAYFLEYCNEALKILISEVVVFFAGAPWKRKPSGLSRAVFLELNLPQPGAPVEYEDKQRLKDVLDKAARAIREPKATAKRPRDDRDEPTLRDTSNKAARSSLVSKFPFGIDLAAVRTTDSEGKTICRQHAVGGRGCIRGANCSFSHAVSWTPQEIARGKQSAINKGDTGSTIPGSSTPTVPTRASDNRAGNIIPRG
jgi:hypothetical protein